MRGSNVLYSLEKTADDCILPVNIVTEYKINIARMQVAGEVITLLFKT